MAEADHLFLRPMPNLMVGEAPAAALFTYMNPDQYGDIVRKFVGKVSRGEGHRGGDGAEEALGLSGADPCPQNVQTSDEEVKKVPRIWGEMGLALTPTLNPIPMPCPTGQRRGSEEGAENWQLAYNAVGQGEQGVEHMGIRISN